MYPFREGAKLKETDDFPMAQEGKKDYCNQFRIFISLRYWLSLVRSHRFSILNKLPASAPHTSLPILCALSKKNEYEFGILARFCCFGYF